MSGSLFAMAARRAAGRPPAGLTLAAVLAAAFAAAMTPAAGVAAVDARNYRQLVADAVAATIKTIPASAFQAGPLRVAQAPQPGDYVVCLRTQTEERPVYFAAFIADGRVETIRRAIGIDRCWLETAYASLPRAAAPPKADAAAGRAPGQPARRPLRKR